MKKIFSITILFFFFCRVYTQQLLPVATDKTVTLIFPFSIIHFDYGRNDVLVQPVAAANNILLVKAGQVQMEMTSLTVVCSDGNAYPFKVQYDSMPATWVWTISPVREANTNTYAAGILDNPAITKRPGVNESGMSFCVSGIYIRNDVMYYQLWLCNHSPIDYDIDQLQFFIRDKRKARKTARQETIVPFLTTVGNMQKVKANDNNTVVIAITAMTMAQGKYLGVQLLEKNGGRNLLLKIKNRHLLKAVPLPAVH